MLSDAKTHVTQMSPAADKYVKKMILLAKQIHTENEEKRKSSFLKQMTKLKKQKKPCLWLKLTNKKLSLMYSKSTRRL